MRGWKAAVGLSLLGRRLPIRDRRRGLLRRRGRQRRLGAGFLCVRVGTGRLRRNVGWPCACRRRIGRRGRLGFSTGRRLQRWRRLRELRGIAGHDLVQRKRCNDQPKCNQHGRKKHVTSVVAFAVIGRHVVRPRIVPEVNGGQAAKFPWKPDLGNRILETGLRCYNSTIPASPSSVPKASSVPLAFQASAETAPPPFRRTRISAPSSNRTISTVPSP